MAQRGKRINRHDNDSASCPGAIKRRKCRVGVPVMDMPITVAILGPSEEEEAMASFNQGQSSWTPRPLSDIKISSIYNRSAVEQPAELYRKDLISAMKLPDSEPLNPNEYWIISDQWKQEWEKGVQVPVNPDSLPEPTVTLIQNLLISKLYGEFKLPKKFLRISRDESFNAEKHYLSTTPARAEKACGYDLDDTDIAWLEVLNGERALCGQCSITESQLERVIEELEHCCWNKIQTIIKNEEGLGIEYDENVICDVCRSPDSEEGNEMVFCDFCNICVHQACYGITSIPDGSWLCRTCSLGQRPECVLCPNPGGAMKSTRSGQKWAHVSCALWIPEVSIGCVERMEPITKISSIPQSRWALICVLCRERVGACIQCSIKTCKTAYHVTCAFKHGLEMKAIIEDEQAEDGVKLRSYCQKHGKINTKEKINVGGAGSGSGIGGSDSDEGEIRRRKRKDMSSEEKNQARAAKLQEIEAEFDKHVSLKDITNQQLDVDLDAIIYIYNYWKLKRRSGHNKPLLPPRYGELSGSGIRVQGQAADNEKMRKFVQLRQDLERVRNLCYMVNRREKLCRTFLRLREQIFHKQALLVSGMALSPSTAAAIFGANHGPSIYDHLYSHTEAETHSYNLESLLSRIKGLESPKASLSNEKNHPDFNGASNKLLHYNGSVSRKKLYISDLSSISSSETDQPKQRKNTNVIPTHPDKKLHQLSKNKGLLKIQVDSSTEDEDKQPTSVIKDYSSKVSLRRKTKNTSRPDWPYTSMRKVHDESSESELKTDMSATRSRTLQHMERELGSGSGSDSDELLPISNKSAVLRLGPASVAEIYSDTDSSLDRASLKSTHFTVKPVVKSYLPKEKGKDKDKVKEKQKYHDTKESKDLLSENDKKERCIMNKGNQKPLNQKKECIASAMIVPQRKAAKKASEIMQRSQNKKDTMSSTNTMISCTISNEPLLDIKSQSEDVKPHAKHFKESKDPKFSSSISTSSKKYKENKVKETKDTTKAAKGNDIYDFEKDSGGDALEIIAYVPQRQAAKKAAEHIKSGISSKSLPSCIEQDTLDNKLKKDTVDVAVPIVKKKHEMKQEESITSEESSPALKKSIKKITSKIPSESSSSSSTSSSCNSSSDSSSDSDEAKVPEQILHRTSAIEPRTITSATSSESDSGQYLNNIHSTATIVSKAQLDLNTGNSSIENKVFTRKDKDVNLFSPTSEMERKLKKLPDKKLKTSDGRHGQEFQPPSTERDEQTQASSTNYKDEQTDNKYFKERRQQQFISKYKLAEYKDSSAKKFDGDQSQQQRYKQQYVSQAQTNESMLSGSRDYDGSRSIFEFKSSKKYNPVIKQSQHKRYQSSSFTKKEDICKIGKGKAIEACKRKSVDVAQKEEKNNSKNASSLKKMEKKLNEKCSEKIRSDDYVDYNSSLTSSRTGTVESIMKIPTLEVKGASIRNEGNNKKSRKNDSKRTVSLEEEMKQRRAERDSTKKSLKGLDKLLEKCENLDKLSRSRNIETVDENKSQQIENCNRPENYELCKTILSKNKYQEKNKDLKISKSETNTSISITSEIIYTKCLKDIPLVERFTENNKTTEEKIEDPLDNIEYTDRVEKQADQHQCKDQIMNKTITENLFLKSMPGKPTLMTEMNEKENSNKQRKSTNRSIFSPQHGISKDTEVPELFDFDQDILTDDMVNDDGFSIPRDAEERTAPLSFSFNNDLWFKEDTKEDSARETLHLVEKLRMELSKKSNSSQFELETTITSTTTSISIDTESKGTYLADMKLENQEHHQEPQQQQIIDSSHINTILRGSSTNVNNSNNDTKSHLPDVIVQVETLQLDGKPNPCNTNNSDITHPAYTNEDIETVKVAMAERAKLDRAEADERWVPPSTDSFNTAEQFSALIDNQNHRYELPEQQFSSDLSTTVLVTDNTATGSGLSQSQIHIDMQEQYIIRAASSIQQNIDSNNEQAAAAQNLDSLVEQQVDSLPTHMDDEITPIEMVNRHLIGLRRIEGEQNSAMDRALDKDEIGSDIARHDYVSMNSPFNDIPTVRSDTRWAESQVLPSRRSTSSSITSTSSIDDRSGISPYKNSSSAGLPPISFPACSAEPAVDTYHSYEPTTNYTGPVSLFPPQSSTAQISYPSPGSAIFPPPFGTPFPTPHTLLPHVSKPLEDQLGLLTSPCTAAFTSSSHNMAFTAAMVSPSKLPSPRPSQLVLEAHELQHENLYPNDIDEEHDQLEGSQARQQLSAEESSVRAVATAFLNSVSDSVIPDQPIKLAQEENPNEQIKSTYAHVNKKFPTKPTRTSARFSSLQAKSPGKSPRHQEIKLSQSNRGRSRSTKSAQNSYRARGRGRGRGRAKTSQHNSSLQSDESIQNKLIGTVYDFESDEDSPVETNIADLRTMRERKKSIEFSAVMESERHDSFSIQTNNSAASQLLSLSEPRRVQKDCIENKKITLNSPAIHGNESTVGTESESSICHRFNDSVMPMLPGPVDMRTYSSSINAQCSSLHDHSYKNHLLGSFTASTDHSIPDVEEDIEKELHSTLIVDHQPDPAMNNVSSLVNPSVVLGDLSKISSMDSRNQLKVKIKGPFLDANYATASTVVLPIAQVNPIITPMANNVSAIASGTSNLRRMRKKELLRQYCSQDMNMDATGNNITSAPTIIPPVSRTVITIPKAVASMTSIPTREDYKAVVDANMEKKRRKERISGVNFGSFGDTHASSMEEQQQMISCESRRLSFGAMGSAERRRGRQPRQATQLSAGISGSTVGSGPPKLKIKISSSVASQENNLQQEGRSNIRPPKKRLSNIPNMPSMEELKRESMKYRRMIMEDFYNSSEKASRIKRDRKDKNGKRKKKQTNKKEGRVEILQEGAAPPKLIIRLGKSNQLNEEPESIDDKISTLTSVIDSVASGVMGNAEACLAASCMSSIMIDGTISQENCEQARLGPPPSMESEDETGQCKSKLSEIALQEGKRPPAKLEHSSVSALRNVRCAKVSPIRLKLTRCQEGYELKSPGTVRKNQSVVMQSEDLKKQVIESIDNRKEGGILSSRRDEEFQSMGQSTTAKTSTAQHNSSSCPPALLPQGCQVR